MWRRQLGRFRWKDYVTAVGTATLQVPAVEISAGGIPSNLRTLPRELPMPEAPPDLLETHSREAQVHSQNIMPSHGVHVHMFATSLSGFFANLRESSERLAHYLSDDSEVSCSRVRKHAGTSAVYAEWHGRV
jgi:hypothetical protein